MHLLRILASAAVAAALALPMTLAGPVGAVTADSYSWTAAGNADASYNWAGYVSADQGSQYSAISASWIVPAVSAQAGSDLSADAAWVGIGGTTSGDLIQAGTQALVDSSNHTQYEAWYEVLPDASQPVPLLVSAGDSVQVSLAQTSPGEWHIAFADTTTGKSYATDVAYNSSLSSAEWVQEMPSMARGRSFIPLDDFNTIAFSDASVTENGVVENLSQAHASPLEMVNIKGETLAEPSALVSQGSSFAVMRTGALASAGDEPRQRQRFEILGPRF